jgi:hypothetical protein
MRRHRRRRGSVGCDVQRSLSVGLGRAGRTGSPNRHRDAATLSIGLPRPPGLVRFFAGAARLQRSVGADDRHRLHVVPGIRTGGAADHRRRRGRARLPLDREPQSVRPAVRAPARPSQSAPGGQPGNGTLHPDQLSVARALPRGRAEPGVPAGSATVRRCARSSLAANGRDLGARVGPGQHGQLGARPCGRPPRPTDRTG